MKAIILAAGRGQRLSPFTDDKPKCLLSIAGRSILSWQVEAFESCGITDMVIVKGYRGNTIPHEGFRDYWNYDYHRSNMIASLFCAESELQGEVVVSYADILFERRLLRALIEAPACDIVIPVDTEWAYYYTRRFGSPFAEAESLIFDTAGRVLRIGDEAPNPAEIQGRFIGLLRLTAAGTTSFKELYHKVRPHGWDQPWMRGRSLEMAYMTDFLQALIDEGVSVFALPVRRGWIELDSNTDYLNVLEWNEEGTLEDIFRFDR